MDSLRALSRAIAITVGATLLLLGAIEKAAAARKGLVIGIDKYKKVKPLDNAVSDAILMASKLRQIGYKTTLLQTEFETERENLLLRFSEFVSDLQEGDDAVVFYSGHGVEVLGANYLVPRDAPGMDVVKSAAALPDFLISFRNLIDRIKGRSVNANIWIIDACRENPFSDSTKSLGSGQGLAEMHGQAGSFIFYAAAAGEKARDKLPNDPPTEKNSVYTRTLARFIVDKQHEPVHSLAPELRPVVLNLTKDLPTPQRPTYYNDLDGPWCFNDCSEQSQTRITTGNVTKEEVKFSDILAPIPGGDRPSSLPANAIFLGKKSSATDCEKRTADVRPFGCQTLIALASTDDPSSARRPYINSPLSPMTAVNIRKQAPSVFEKAGANYACIVRVLRPGEKVHLASILDVDYAGDTFYWGLLDSKPLACLSEKTP